MVLMSLLASPLGIDPKPAAHQARAPNVRLKADIAALKYIANDWNSLRFKACKGSILWGAIYDQYRSLFIYTPTTS